jgi:hypothetical protein
MKSKFFILCVLILGFFKLPAFAQSVYPVTSGEIIFTQNNTSFNSAFLGQYPGASVNSSNVRFTAFFQLGQYWHCDMNDKFGLYSGLAIRNIGMITDEVLPQTVSDNSSSVIYKNYKLIRRQYTLGVPLALKLGSFDKNFYIFGGGEYEMAFHMKEKYWSDTMDRAGSKTKTTTWFSSQTPTFLPSVFLGVQLPKGINLKFKYYLTDFLNSDYKLAQNSQAGSTFNVSDLTRYKESRIIYFSLCWQFRTLDM